MATMDTALEEHDPYVLTDLKEPSYFTLQPLQSLETPDWNADLPGDMPSDIGLLQIVSDCC